MTINLTLREGANGKGSPLTNQEVDQNFINLRQGIDDANSNIPDLQNDIGDLTTLVNQNTQNISLEQTQRESAINSVTDLIDNEAGLRQQADDDIINSLQSEINTREQLVTNLQSQINNISISSGSIDADLFDGKPSSEYSLVTHNHDGLYS